MISECEFCQLSCTTVKLRTYWNGKFRTHYHRYKTREKAERMYSIFARSVEDNGGVSVSD